MTTVDVPWTTLIDPQTLARHLGGPGLIVLDCRFDIADGNAGWQAYGRGHLPGAFYAHLETDLSDMGRSGRGRHPLPDPPQFAAVMGRYGIEPTRQVVCYDDAGGALAAARAWWLLRNCGHSRVAVLDGGWSAWTAADLPVAADKPVHRIGDYPLAWDASGVVDDAGLLADDLAAGRIMLIDARASARYRGEIEPIDSKAGHVPGAVNRPFSDNLASDGRFKDSALLREEFHALIGDRPPREVVHMCGSGVTALHNLLAMDHAGFRGSRLYAPSWSGWIVDPQRAVAVGG
jgi:thiosulfate/3-mercaptopyruvate sulfurtransferase